MARALREFRQFYWAWGRTCRCKSGLLGPDTREGWIGAIDEVAFYRTALSAEDVKRHYNAMLHP